MQFVYNPRKAAQAATFLVNLSGGSISVLALMKLLYLADRKCLVSRGRPITGDRMVNMPHGPVLSRIYDEIKLGKQEGEPQPWYECLAERQGNEVGLKNGAAPCVDELSDFERQALTNTHGDYAHLGPAGLRKLTHALPEYEDPQGSSLPIDPVFILREEGWTAQEIQEALMDARQEVFLHRVCASNGTTTFDRV
jgi:uncharacterized phage-associated protein